jgi:hypothetical protein
MRGTVIPLALLVLVLAGCGAARQSAPRAKDRTAAVASIDPSAVTTKILGGTTMQQKVLREVLAGIGSTSLEEVEIKGSPRKPLAVGLVVPHDVENVMAEWHAGLLAQGFAERSRELGLPPVAFLAAERGDADGVDFGPGPASGPSPTLSDAMRAAAGVRRAAEQHGAEVRRIEILKPNGYAFLIELRVEGDQAQFLQDGLPRVLQFVEPEDSGFAGDYSLIVDGDGKQVWEGEQAKDGDGWSEMGGTERWDLAGCSPFFRGGPAGRGPPPCPADSAAQAQTKIHTKVESVASADVTTKIVGATPKQESILREILGGLGETVIEEIRVAPAGKPWTPFKPHSVVVRIKTAKTDEKERAGWEAALVAEAFEGRSRALHLQPVAAYEALDDGIALDGPDEPKPDDRTPITREEIESGIVSGAKESRAEIVTLRIVEPRHLAAAVTLRVRDPASFLKHRLRTFLEAVPSSSNRQYDGLYVLVIDPNGKYVWVSAGTVGDTISGGAEGARPDLAACYPDLMYGSATGEEPPPCPVK